MRFALSTFPFRERPLSHQHLVDITALGFDAIEIHAVAGHFDAASREAALSLKDWLADTALTVHAVRVGPPVGSSLATADRSRREDAVAGVTRAVTASRQVTPDVVVLDLGSSVGRAGGGGGRPEPKAVRRSLQTVLAAAEEAGAIRIAVEIGANGLFAPGRLVRMIEDDVDLRTVRLCLDFGHTTDAMTLVDSIEAAAGHLAAVRLHDVTRRGRRHLVPFEGDVDWGTALMTLRKIGYDGTLTLAVDGGADSRGALRRAALARDRLARLLV